MQAISIAPPAVLVVGNGTSTYLSELLFPSVAKAVLKLKRIPIAIVGADAVRHCGAGERAGEVEPWEGGCVLQVGSPPEIEKHHSIKQEKYAHMHAHSHCGAPEHAALGSARARSSPGGRLRAAGGLSFASDRSKRHYSIHACASAALGSARARSSPGGRLLAAGDGIHQSLTGMVPDRISRAGRVGEGNAYIVAQVRARKRTISL